MLPISIGLFLIAAATLMLEVVLIRVFDVILSSNLGYMVITCAMFAFGLAGVYGAVKPFSDRENVSRFLFIVAVGCGIAILFIVPGMNFLPFNYEEIAASPFIQSGSFLGMYAVLIIPFFLTGLIFSTVFSVYASFIQRLYFWDLTGAGVGSLAMIPFFPYIGAGGLVLLAAALMFFAAGLFSQKIGLRMITWFLGVLFIGLPLFISPDLLEFKEHVDKRGVKTAKLLGHHEFSRWDPVSKIDVVPALYKVQTGQHRVAPHMKHVAYDGGSQSSHFYAFDGNFKKLRARLLSGEEKVTTHMWKWGIMASHYLKRDSQQRVLIIGSAAGQETKSALLFNPSAVDTVEMVGTVVELGKNNYADFIGNIFNDPRVTAHVGEGRSFLRSSAKKYDIIEIFSNHTTASLAAGSGAMNPTYLQTADAYQEYFGHLTENGVLHINHHIYPRMVATAALAWQQMGREDFQRHVLVFEDMKPDHLPTVLFKMQPWTREEVKQVQDLRNAVRSDDRIVENPLDFSKSFLSSDFYSGDFPLKLQQGMPYQIRPTTDDHPYFNLIRKTLKPLQPNPQLFVNVSVADYLNGAMKKHVPMDIVHLLVTGAASTFFIVLFIAVPLYFSKLGTVGLAQKVSFLTYFSCLGAGFIILELVAIQVFMKLIGFPLYTYSTVIFTLLVGAGVGSYCTDKFGMATAGRWRWPFIGIGVAGTVLVLCSPILFEIFLSYSIVARVFISVVLIFPLGFFLGMPFPLGILTIEKLPHGFIAWAWGMNGLFTLIGGLASVVLSVFWGFTITLFIGLSLYLPAYIALSWLKRKFEMSEEQYLDQLPSRNAPA